MSERRQLRAWLGLLLAVGCVPLEPQGEAPESQKAPLLRKLPAFRDDFERAELGPDWLATSPAWKLEGGKLCARGARNHPAWLKHKLPLNARIAFTATSASPEGDLKVELWGDGQGFAKGTSYDDATSYLFIYGGWQNRLHVLARLDEHGKDRIAVPVDPESQELHNSKVVAGRPYRFVIERRDGKTVQWWIDGHELAKLQDPNPLTGEGHEHLGFNDWDVPVCFDALEIVPLEP